MVDKEEVTAVGNKIIGSAIPLRIPYMRRDSLEEYPDNCRQKGSRLASMLCNMQIMVRFPERGIAVRIKL